MIGIESDFEKIFEFCDQYPETGHGIPTGSPEVDACIGSLERIGQTIQSELGKQDWTFKVSKGAGAFPRIPWMVFGPKSIVKIAPSKGMYLCIAISEDGSGFVAGLNVATAEKEQWKGLLKKVPSGWKLKIDGKKLNTKYSDGFFNPQPFYRKKWVTSELIDHLRKSADLLLRLERSPKGTPTRKSYQCNQRLSPRLQYSLLTKPFVILTGASGTGKTKLATSLAKHFSNADGSNSELVAVGADWTDNRSVLGFVNHLRVGEDKLPTYESTPILDLLLRAKDDPEVPYFLILDEMNLSHVERYFADFLSAMEHKDGFFKLHSESSDLRRGGSEDADVPAKLDYPANLFVIGTVNIDETTYMFSPKVLDRANVIEFTVTNGEIGEFLKDPKPYQEAEIAAPGVAEGFRALAEQAREMQIDLLPLDGSGGLVANHLLELFDILKSGRFEFAYRTAKEINIYLSVCRHLAEDAAKWDEGGWRHDLDAQILQKLLPKLHGSVGRIGGLLATLANYCHSGKVTSNQSLRLEDAVKLDEKDAHFPKSLVKLKAMIDTLKDEQFVSFIQ